MRAVLILNPAAGVSQLSTTTVTAEENEQAILAALRTYDIEPVVYHTTLEDPGSGLAVQAAQEGAELVIAAGGDGTIHAVATGLIGTQSTLGIISIGSMNNLAHSLSIPHTIEEACEVIAQGVTRTIDTGIINGHPFIEVAGIGLEAALFPAAEEIKRPGILTTIKGIITGLRTLFAFKPTILRISLDGQKKRLYRAIEVTICNSPYYGVHFQIAPGTVMDDGLLDVVIYRDFSKLEYLQNALAISQGRRPAERKMIHRRVKSMRIEARHPVEIQVDGSPQGYTPATLQVLPAALRVRVASQKVPGLSREHGASTKDGQSLTKNVHISI